jgi:hypothetical protein
MANFQKMTLTIAGIILLICIVILILIFVFPNTSQVWPPMVSNCPDYFVDTTGDGSNCTNPLKIIGSPSCMTTPTSGVNAPNFTVGNYIGSTGTCAKYNWATGCEVSWDGITYGVRNPCTNNSSSS